MIVSNKNGWFNFQDEQFFLALCPCLYPQVFTKNPRPAPSSSTPNWCPMRSSRVLSSQLASDTICAAQANRILVHPVDILDVPWFSMLCRGINICVVRIVFLGGMCTPNLVVSGRYAETKSITGRCGSLGTLMGQWPPGSRARPSRTKTCPCQRHLQLGTTQSGNPTQPTWPD